MVTMSKEYSQKYYRENLHVYKSKYNVSTTCPVCGAVIKKKNLFRHQRSIRCQKILELKSI